MFTTHNHTFTSPTVHNHHQLPPGNFLLSIFHTASFYASAAMDTDLSTTAAPLNIDCNWFG